MFTRIADQVFAFFTIWLLVGGLLISPLGRVVVHRVAYAYRGLLGRVK